MSPSKLLNRPFTVIVEGNIGSGKSTFLKNFKRFDCVDVLTEPVNKWTDLDGHNLLGLMYENPSRWALAFQSYVQLTMVQNHVKPPSDPEKIKLKMMERSLHSARKCFAENLHRTGQLPSSEFAVLDKWYEFLVQNSDIKVDMIVYLRTDPEIAHARVKSRARSEEKVIPLEYLKALHEIHEDWLMHDENHPAPVMVIDANGDMNDIPDIFTRHENGILKSADLHNEKKFSNKDEGKSQEAKTQRSPFKSIKANVA